MTQVGDRGITVDLPAGWEADFFRRDPAPVPLGAAHAPEVTTTIVHLANWPLPTERGDFGGGAVELMQLKDVLLVLFEYGEAERGTELFSSPVVPWPLRTTDFDANRLQRPLPGQLGLQQFFSSPSGRPFCLFVVLGSERNAEALVAQVNEVLNTVQLT